MNANSLFKETAGFLKQSPLNAVSETDAIFSELTGMRIFADPLFGVAAADDPLFELMREDGIISREYMPPCEWLDGAKSVISLFLPFDERVRRSNREPGGASPEWRHGRIEGQEMINALCAHICSVLREKGFEAVFPAGDARFAVTAPYISNWSERHAAYVCGLGTFGLSRGLITKKGMAGRFGSVITTAEMPATAREYSAPFEYCIMCGRCADRCPAKAIDLSKGVIDGKNQALCGAFVNASKTIEGAGKKLRYGCGKCQVGVPCETGIPGMTKQSVDRYGDG